MFDDNIDEIREYLYKIEDILYLEKRKVPYMSNDIMRDLATTIAYSISLIDARKELNDIHSN